MVLEKTESESSSAVELTEAESELYDRQIRLWGLESQMRLRSAKVFISGLSGIGAEITKNIILSGVNSVKLHDEKSVTEEEVCSQFLVSKESVGVNRAVASIDRSRRLNPMVEISADTEPLSEKGEQYFSQFDVVVISGVKSSELIRINNLCRAKDVKFFAVDVWGMFGYCFADLQQYSFVEEIMKHKPVANQKVKTELISTTVKKELSFPPLQEVFDFDFNCQKFQRNLKRFGPAFIELRILHKFRETNDRDPSYKSRDEDILKLEQIRDELIDSKIASPQFTNVFSQISPATAIVGGIVAQEVIKAITKKDTPVRNVFLFDPENCCGFVEFISTSSS